MKYIINPFSRSVAAVSAVALLTFVLPGLAHESDTEGHVPANTNYGFEVIGRDLLVGVQDGLYTDVWSHNGYAYVGTFQEPGCTDAGVFIVDIEAAIANFDGGVSEGATIAEIKSAPNTRINDVKVHRVGDTDVLITTQEPCGDAIPGVANAGNTPLDKKGEWRGSGPASQKGQGGISLYDVTDPTKPIALRKNFLEFGGVHNTFSWDWEGKSYLIGTANTFDFFDTFIVDISKPQSPNLLVTTGALDWFAVGAFLDGQFETGSSAGIFNHDVWVDFIDGVPTAVVSYWDGGFVTLDLTDPANPVFLGDSTYPDPEPIVGEPYEGNAHAAVFGGNGDYIFGGDEDFSDSSFGINYSGVDYAAGQSLFGPGSDALAGTVVWTGGEGCTAAEVPAATSAGQVALIQRGACFFQDKAESAQAQGYAGFIIANNAAGGDALINMAGSGASPEPTIPGVFIGYSTGEIIKANPGGFAAASSVFDGWGYFHVINNTGAEITVPSRGMANPDTMTVPQLHELGYYAPAEAVEPPAAGAPPVGDLTMHNIEADPRTQDLVPMFNQGPRMFVSWYSLGMRAIEYRPGHYHDNSNGEGSYSQNVHEVGRFIAEEGSNFWGVHVDERPNGDQIILASDRNTGLWVFSFSCVTRVEIGDGEQDVFYCDPATDSTGG
ncbi:PA domain-containing protein [Yoonia sediminilitoris]|uniref:PA domain-containing protein n=1 Tax=Yoonia sediminilitoris TaxID=1286148 RepID=A0A2T6KC01_9RHOB|nr:PA domain-containing protein [Yoonia sediminilitoris]PUB12392.1 PA domain-containing protein [Yoonia sediminilitoris]RCW93086.1 PA domain-containing protein [Yoonia sediminilitoris]